MNMNSKFSRRSFLEKAGVAVAVTSAASVSGLLHGCGSSASSNSSSNTPRKISPGDKVNLACVGIGNRGGELISALYSTGECNVVALCDTDLGGKHTLAILEKFPNAKRFTDFRVMLEEMASDIDAVSVGTPDFSHFPACMLAMSMGKHVIVEKPMAHTFNEVQLMMDAAKKYGVVTQMGNQGHSEANYFQFKAWKDAGIIKNVTAITAHMNNSRRWHEYDYLANCFPAAEAIPSTLDWDLWLGTERFHDYTKEFDNGQWRSWYDFGMGALGDWGAHILDTAHEFLELGLPTEVGLTHAKGHNNFFFPYSSTIEFKFPKRGEMPPCVVTWYDGTDNYPPVPDNYGGVELDPTIPPSPAGTVQPSKLNPGKIIYGDYVLKGGTHGSTLSFCDKDEEAKLASKLPNVPETTSGHYLNFLRACRGEEKARSSFDIAGPLTQVFCLGVVAQWLNTRYKFDPIEKRVLDNPIANALLCGAAPRKGWEEFYSL